MSSGNNGANLLLINSNDKDAFAVIMLNNKLTVSKAAEFIDETNPLNKKPDKLINCVDKLSKEISLKDADAIAVTIGPGSFTGIRVGLSIAKGIAFASDKKIIPINNFELLLNRINEIQTDIKYCVLIPAKLPEYYYSVMINGLEQSSGCIEVGNLSNILEKSTIIVGDFDDETSIKHSYFEYINVNNHKSELDSMLELAQKALHGNKLYDAENIEPLYLKDFIVKK